MCTTATHGQSVITQSDLLIAHASKDMKEMVQVVLVGNICKINSFLLSFITEALTHVTRLKHIYGIMQMSMNAQPQLTTVMELLTALTMRGPSAASAAKTTLEME